MLYIIAMIKAIEERTVHKICSGQVIIDLGIAVKELVVIVLCILYVKNTSFTLNQFYIGKCTRFWRYCH